VIFEEYRARFRRVVDGDTVELDVDLGFSVITRQLIRVRYVDTPERGEPNYSQARDFTGAWFRRNGDALEGWVLINPERTAQEVFVRTFVRYVAEIWSLDHTANLAIDLTNAGLVKPKS
jgi:micrococcal nuclease